MDVKIVKVTDKGQISLPVRMRESLAISEGDELIITKTDNALIMKKIKKDDFSDLSILSASALNKIWDNPGDEIWNTYLDGN